MKTHLVHHTSANDDQEQLVSDSAQTETVLCQQSTNI